MPVPVPTVLRVPTVPVPSVLVTCTALATFVIRIGFAMRTGSTVLHPSTSGVASGSREIAVFRRKHGPSRCLTDPRVSRVRREFATTRSGSEPIPRGSEFGCGPVWFVDIDANSGQGHGLVDAPDGVLELRVPTPGHDQQVGGGRTVGPPPPVLPHHAFDGDPHTRPSGSDRQQRRDRHPPA
ncbi:Uncharacterised protein [Nocardia otitidiscaviarum]|uniref:Uncharacterized protein n=1 Tax=Nocardia otitidiscaviarum TaxID=1823 RepID=A0A379JKT8_9NOCA|nr:Uncharacterised protein [Nocardia otitidiscaviarum]